MLGVSQQWRRGCFSPRLCSHVQCRLHLSMLVSAVVCVLSSSTTWPHLFCCRLRLGSNVRLSSGTSSFCSGLWTTSGGDFTWTRRTGGTPSSNTGPNTGPTGASYMYTEASNNNPAKTAYLKTSLGSYAGMKFSYHMYGSNMGTLKVETRNSSGWYEAWKRDGQQQASNGAPWSTALVWFSQNFDKVRFTGITGTGFRSDAAVGDVELFVEGHVPFFELHFGRRLRSTSVSNQVGDHCG